MANAMSGGEMRRGIDGIWRLRRQQRDSASRCGRDHRDADPALPGWLLLDIGLAFLDHPCHDDPDDALFIEKPLQLTPSDHPADGRRAAPGPQQLDADLAHGHEGGHPAKGTVICAFGEFPDGRRDRRRHHHLPDPRRHLLVPSS
jgi:hypothetical protein